MFFILLAFWGLFHETIERKGVAMESSMPAPLQFGTFNQAQAQFYGVLEGDQYPQAKAPSIENLEKYPVCICCFTLESIKTYYLHCVFEM